MSILSADVINVLHVVASVYEISVDDVLSHSRILEIVDAHHTAIALLNKQGIYISRIASVFNMSDRNVRHILTAFPDRKRHSRIVGYNYETIRRKLGGYPETTVSK